MAKNFLFVNANADYEEGDSTFESTDFINASTGASDAAKPILLDSTGKLDASFYDFTDIDHDQLLNFVANEHIDWTVDAAPNDIDDANIPNALLLDGSRDATGILSYDSSKTFTLDAQIVDKKYVDDQISTLGTTAEWLDSVIDILLTPPGTPTTGDRYLINGTGTGAWAGQDFDVAEWNGASWDFTTPTTGTYVSVDDETDGLYYFGGTGPWVKKFYESTTASLGVEKVGVDLRLDLLSGGGLKLTGNEVGVEPNDFAGTGLIDDGSDNLAIDFSTTFNDLKAVSAQDLASNANGLGASVIGIEDAGNFTTETTVEGAIQDLYGVVDGVIPGVIYTAGAGGVSKGDLLYVSGADTVLPYSNISVAEVAIGIAESAVSAGNPVTVLANDTVITSIVSGATPGTKYFWTGTGWTSNFASFTTGQYVYVGGVAKNATDVHVEVDFVTRKA
jgi:hypothetical protein